MAIITKLPNSTIISGFKGTLDFYVYMGIPCVRMWPHSPGKNRSPEVSAQWARFANAARLWRETTPIVRQAYQQLTPPVGLTNRDMFFRAYISGIFRYTQSDPP